MVFCIFTRSTTYHNKSGGLETQNKVLCEGLVKEGHHVFVVTTGKESEGSNKDFIKKGESLLGTLPIYIFTESPSGIYSKQWFNESVRAYREISRSNKVDVLISQSSAGLEVFKQIENIKKIAISHGTSFGEWETRFKTTKTIRNVARLIIKDTPMALSGWWEDYHLFNCSDKVVCVSGVVKDRIKREFPMFRDKLTIIDNGVDLGKFEIKNSKLETSSDFVLLYVGRVVVEKGLDVLLTAISELKMIKDLRLLIVGGGVDLATLKVLAKQLDLPITFVGEISNEETVKYYQQADVFVLPTLRQEGFPMVLAEAMAAGLPIIASRIGGIPSAIIDENNGILVTPGSLEELSKAIELLYHDEKLRKKLSESAKKLSEEKYSQKAMVKKYLDLLI